MSTAKSGAMCAMPSPSSIIDGGGAGGKRTALPFAVANFTKRNGVPDNGTKDASFIPLIIGKMSTKL